jgi:hypothetical protein
MGMESPLNGISAKPRHTTDFGLIYDLAHGKREAATREDAKWKLTAATVA